MRFDKVVVASVSVCVAAVSCAFAQEAVPTSPSMPPSAVYTYNRPFYAAAERADLVAFMEYRFLTTEGKANIWLRKQGTGLDFEGAVDGISRRDYDKEVSKRKPQIDALVASGRVIVMNGQQVHVLLVAPPDMKEFNAFEWKGSANYIARGTALMPMRLVELLEGPGKGQKVWIAGSFSDRQEAFVPGGVVLPAPVQAVPSAQRISLVPAAGPAQAVLAAQVGSAASSTVPPFVVGASTLSPIPLLTVGVPAGTRIAARIENDIRDGVATVNYTITDDVRDATGGIMIPRGSKGYGSVVQYRRPVMFGGPGKTEVSLDSVVTPEGRTLTLASKATKYGRDVRAASIFFLPGWLNLFTTGGSGKVGSGNNLTFTAL